MKTPKTMIWATLTALMFASFITSSAHGFLGGIGVEGPAVMRIKGKVFCSGCNLEHVRKTQPSELRLYQLTYEQGQVVMKVDWVSNPRRWNHVVWPARVWLRGTEAQLHKLTAEENQRKDIAITGILSNSRTFDIVEVTIDG